MHKLLMIGVDALDAILLSRFEADLPNLSTLKQHSPAIKMKSVFPPDSPVAWSSIYTGLSPARTGIVYFRNPMDKKSFVSALGDTEDSIHGRLRGSCFWDFISESGMKVCVLFPHAIYPPWPVNGVMVCRTMQAITKDYPPLITYPDSMDKEYNLKGLNTLDAISSQKVSSLYRVIDDCKELLANEFALGLKLLQKDNWDLFFMYSSVLDAVQHCFWNYYDENDPTYIDNNSFKNVIKDFYILLDAKIGEIISAADPDTTIIVFSDHGHGMRPVKLVNINEVLRQKGYLIARQAHTGYGLPGYFMKKLKGTLERIVVSTHGLPVIASKFLRRFPWAKRIYATPAGVDWNKSIACVSDLSGIKAYSYAGVAIRKDRIPDLQYEELRSSLIKLLSDIREPGTGEKLVKWIERREDVYHGEYINRYPDIIFQLEDGYGVGWSIHSGLIGLSQTHGVHPGAHRADSPVFLISEGKDKMNIKDNMSLMDIAPTIFDLLAIDVSKCDFDGKSIFK